MGDKPTGDEFYDMLLHRARNLAIGTRDGVSWNGEAIENHPSKKATKKDEMKEEIDSYRHHRFVNGNGQLLLSSEGFNT